MSLDRSRGSRALFAAASIIVATVAGSGAPPVLAAADGCVVESEPNDRPEDAPRIEGGFCQSGTLTESDQDLVVWTVTPAAALFPWTFRVDGVPRTITSIHVLPVTSAADEATLSVGGEVLRVDSDAVSRAPGVASDIVLAPGRYVLGISKGTNVGPALETLDYQVAIEPTVVHPSSGDVEPNDVPGDASPVSGAFAITGDLQGSADVFRWTLDPADAARTWDLDARGLPGSAFSLALETDAGLPLATAFIGPDANAHLYDLRLPAGSYRITLGSGTAGPTPYVLGAVATADPHADAEPNDRAELAMPIALGVAVTGRLAGSGDVDTYRLSVDEALATHQLDIRLEGTRGISRQLCVYDEPRVLSHCRQGLDGLSTVSNLLLPAAGDHLIEVSGADLASDGYLLRVDDIGPATSAREIEPDDVPRTASPLDVLQPLTGHADGIEDDLYRAHVSGAPQLWRVDVTGDGVEGLTWMREDTIELGTGALVPEGGRVVLRDLWLLPGDHWLRVRARSTDYTVTFTPLGQPPANGERESNDDSMLAGLIAPGEDRVGRLSDRSDVDVYRFSLAAAEHLTVAVDPPADGAVTLGLVSSGVRLVDIPAGLPGEAVGTEALLPAGDYEVWLTPAIPSESTYTVRVERGDPFADGSSSGGVLPATVEVRAAAATVAAWSAQGQRVAGEVALTGTGTVDRQLVLQARTSDDAWSVDLAQTDLTLPAGGTVVVPFTIAVPADAWADVPVRITVAASDPSGARSTGSVELTPRQDDPPVAPEPAWTLPDALLGGLDVAAVSLGGVPLLGTDPARDALLHDGYAVPGPGWQAQLTGGPVTVGVDLAGDAALPIAGFILDPLGGDPGLGWRPRDVELLLSEDGVDYRVVVTAELSPVMREQAFVLDPPVSARFAQLRISSAWTQDSPSVALGEWKVIAQPGSRPDPSAAAFNVADPALGGHIVALDTLRASDATMAGMLDEDATPWLPNPGDAASVSWIVGFRDDRTAGITELQWVDPPGVDPGALLPNVRLDISTDTTLGPWRPLATWDLVRAADGSVRPLVLAEPTWARFVRITSDGPAGASVVWAMPATLRVLERPIDGSYRSIVGEWGRWARRGIAERLDPRIDGTSSPAEADDADDDPASATPLAIGVAAAGEVRRGRDVDWFAVTMPAGQDLLTLTLTGEPFVAATVTLQDADGAPVALEATDQGGATAVWTAEVEPGATYRVLVEQPPVSTAVAYDTSGSIVKALPSVADALRAFAAGLVPGLDSALVVPFQEPPILDHWSDDPIELQAAIEAQTLFPAGSSAAELGMLDALGELERRPGTRALVVLTDAESDSRGQAPDVFAALARVRPLVFTIHLGDLGEPALTTHLMQDWAASSAGTYQITVSRREIDRTFQRIAAWLRRPARYTLTATTGAIPKEPGSLHLTAATPRAGAIGGVTVELVLDTSGSMLKKLGKVRRIDVAQRVITRLATETLPEGLPVMLRTFVARPRSCDTVLAVPLGPLDPAAMTARIRGLKVAGSTRTPLGATLHAVGDDLAGVQGRAIVVFVTDGQETCKGDPAAEIQRLIDQGVDVQLNLVGFAIDDVALSRDLAAWAALGHGTAYDADNEQELASALTQLLRAPFQVFDEGGTLVAGGIVGGDPVALPVGSYRVEVQSDPPVTLDPVVIGSGARLDIVIGAEE